MCHVALSRLLKETWSELAPKIEIIIGRPVTPEKAKAIACFSQPVERNTNEGFIYFISTDKLVKIGYTNNIKQRTSTLKTLSPKPLRLLGVMKGSKYLERKLHNNFIKYIKHGEWFSASTELLKFIEANCGGAKNA